jgi:hypothetical protein
MPQNDQDEQQSKVDRRNHKQVHCADTGHLIAQERLPSRKLRGSGYTVPPRS